jgi:hypothetical protein
MTSGGQEAKQRKFLLFPRCYLAACPLFFAADMPLLSESGEGE